MPSLLRSTTCLAGLAVMLLNTAPTTASPPDVTFLCNRMPEVSSFPQTLNWDDYGGTGDNKGSVAKARRKAAGCQSGNKCNKGRSGAGSRGAGYRSCDEYPFASTSDSITPTGHQVSRCVPVSQNSAQGNALMQTYGRFKSQGYTSHSLKINFGNPGSSGVKYCLNQACRNDGYEVQDKTIKRRDEDPNFRFYTTLSGIVLGSLDEDELHSNYTRMVDSFETLPLDLDSWFELLEGVEVRMVNDVIVGEISVESLLGQDA
ncbi:hypothetical protein LTR97_005038 [Elasticomyces elasticus]|uniref:Deoxyribonuclease NucA/NucB domain-containing protein n=1 Tax=Elasticomyces elasticus TaxID=574655 RepID=A0AAN7VSY0_9PEZI|nr:hypothetical protein LTR97_005038 [Elasticomyces elasticus]